MSEENKTPETTPEDKSQEQGEKKPKLKFDEAQLQFMQNFAADLAKKESEKRVAELEAKFAADKKALEERLTALQAEKEKKPEAPVKDEKSAQELEVLKNQMKEMKGLIDGYKNERDDLKKRMESAEDETQKSRKKDLFFGAMKDANVTFFDPLEAYDLAEANGYEWDKNSKKPVIMNRATGAPRLNENGEEMSVIDFMKDFASKKKYLVKAPQQDGGSGSGENRKVETNKSGKAVDEMSAEEFEAFRQKILNTPRTR